MNLWKAQLGQRTSLKIDMPHVYYIDADAMVHSQTSRRYFRHAVVESKQYYIQSSPVLLTLLLTHILSVVVHFR
tara:strand:- start:273 stop:494 length:222 start_codon:yes stop_codon:yes gene_type:complete